MVDFIDIMQGKVLYYCFFMDENIQYMIEYTIISVSPGDKSCL